MGRDGSVYFNGEGGIWKYDAAARSQARTRSAFTGSPGMRSSTREGRDGSIYGTTYGGGTSGNGTVFQFTSDDTLTTLLNFVGTNGANPAAELLAGGDGSLYGTTRNEGA